MNIQQLSLTSETLPPLKKNLFWFLGLVLYLISQLISVAAVGYAPLALVAALFTTMLFFDVIIARCFLKVCWVAPLLEPKPGPWWRTFAVWPKQAH